MNEKEGVQTPRDELSKAEGAKTGLGGGLAGWLGHKTKKIYDQNWVHVPDSAITSLPSDMSFEQSSPLQAHRGGVYRRPSFLL